MAGGAALVGIVGVPRISICFHKGKRDRVVHVLRRVGALGLRDGHSGPAGVVVAPVDCGVRPGRHILHLRGGGGRKGPKECGHCMLRVCVCQALSLYDMLDWELSTTVNVRQDASRRGGIKILLSRYLSFTRRFPKLDDSERKRK